MSKEKEIEEIRKKLTNEIPPESKEMKIIFDGKQYSVRIPASFAKAVKINPANDTFKFTLIVPPYEKGEPKLTGELIHGKKKAFDKQL